MAWYSQARIPYLMLTKVFFKPFGIARSQWVKCFLLKESLIYIHWNFLYYNWYLRIIVYQNRNIFMQENAVRADSRFAPSQWETPLLCNDVSHWLGLYLESALAVMNCSACSEPIFLLWLKKVTYVISPLIGWDFAQPKIENEPRHQCVKLLRV